MRLPARLVLLLVTCYLLLVTPTAAFAQPQTAQQPNPYLSPNTNPDVPKDLNTWTQNVVINIMASMNCQIVGINPVTPDQKCLGFDPTTGKIGFVQGGGGAIGVVGNLIAITYTPPASTSQYLSYMGDKFGIAKPAYAQTAGTGFRGIQPIIRVWEVFRNITYLLFVVVFVIIGFAIMLRVKIDPRTVMTIQNSIPKVIIGLILVTFSFAIAGVLIDLMYVIIYLVFNLLNNPSIITPNTATMFTNAQRTLSNDSVFGIANNVIDLRDMVLNMSGGVKEIVQGIFWTNSTNSQQGIFLLSGLQNIFDFSRNTVGTLLGGIAGVLALLIVAVAVLWSLFRLWFQLIIAYVTILIDIVFAPVWILAGMLPGSPVSFSSWLRDFGAKLSAFPVTIFMFLLGRILIDSFTTAPPGTTFVPPLVGAINTNALGAILGVGIILLTPQVVTMIKEAIKAPKFPYGAAIGAAIGAGPGVVGAGAGALTNPYGALAIFVGGNRSTPLGMLWGKMRGERSEQIAKEAGSTVQNPVEGSPKR